MRIAQNAAEEIWLAVINYEGFYEISNQGRVRSLNRTVLSKRGYYERRRCRLLKLTTTKQGYKIVSLHQNGISKTSRVHRLVLGAFVGPCPIGYQCAHNDGVPGNNNLANLQWKTPKENAEDRVLHGTNNNGERHGSAVLRNGQVNEIRKRYQNGCRINGVSALAREFQIDRSTVRAVIERRSWFHI